MKPVQLELSQYMKAAWKILFKRHFQIMRSFRKNKCFHKTGCSLKNGAEDLSEVLSGYQSLSQEKLSKLLLCDLL